MSTSRTMPASARRLNARGRTLDATETMPSAPASIARAAVGSSPLRTVNVADRSSNNSAILSGSLRASFKPITR